MQKPTFFDEVFFSRKNEDLMQIFAELCAYLEDGRPFPFRTVLISGKSETGKTHLAKTLQKCYPNDVCLVSAAELLFQDGETLKKTFSTSGRHKILVLDDIHLMRENRLLQEHVLFFAEKAQCPVLFLSSSDENILLPLHFRSRLAQGLNFTLAEPDLAIKTLYVQKLSAEQDIKINKEQCLFIARHAGGFRNIQSIFSHIRLFSVQTHRQPTPQEIERIAAQKGQIFALTPQTVISVVAAHFEISEEELTGTRRLPKIVQARQLAMYLCRTLLGETCVEIGRIFGGKDHSTIVHSIKKIEELKVTNKVMNNLVTEVTNKCKLSVPNAK